MIKNALAVLSGLFVAILLILLAITADKQWFAELSTVQIHTKWDILLYWRQVVMHAPDAFFLVLLISFGVSSTVGGLITAMLVEKAHQAYGMLIGFLLLFIAVSDIIFTPNHPTWYELSLFFVFFPFSWLGGKIVEVVMKKKAKYKKGNKIR